MNLTLQVLDAHNAVHDIPFQRSRFPGGEINIRLATEALPRPLPRIAFLQVNIQSSDDLMATLLASDAIRQACPDIDVHLCCPYLPYARQDRVCHPGEAFSLSILASILNAQPFSSITTWDPHSPVATKEIADLHIVEAVDLMPASVVADRPILIAPDAGAVNRVLQIARHHDLPYTWFVKTRDAEGGAVQLRPGAMRDVPRELLVSLPRGDSPFPFTSPRIPDRYRQSLDSKHYLIVDDICDGGRTFLELAKLMREYFGEEGLRLDLWVTHGIFSHGLGDLMAAYHSIHTANCFLLHPEWRANLHVHTPPSMRSLPR